MSGNVFAGAFRPVLPTMIEAAQTVAPDKPETQPHAAVRTPVFPYMDCAAVVAPHGQFIIRQNDRVHIARRNIL